jgi:hypothetical protein
MAGEARPADSCTSYPAVRRAPRGFIQWDLFNGIYSMGFIQWDLFNGIYSMGFIQGSIGNNFILAESRRKTRKIRLL